MTKHPPDDTMDLIVAIAIAQTALAAIKNTAPNTQAASIATQALTRMNRLVPQPQ